LGIRDVDDFNRLVVQNVGALGFEDEPGLSESLPQDVEDIVQRAFSETLDQVVGKRARSAKSDFVALVFGKQHRAVLVFAERLALAYTQEPRYGRFGPD